MDEKTYIKVRWQVQYFFTCGSTAMAKTPDNIYITYNQRRRGYRRCAKVFQGVPFGTNACPASICNRQRAVANLAGLAKSKRNPQVHRFLERTIQDCPIQAISTMSFETGPPFHQKNYPGPCLVSRRLHSAASHAGRKFETAHMIPKAAQLGSKTGLHHSRQFAALGSITASMVC